MNEDQNNISIHSNGSSKRQQERLKQLKNQVSLNQRDLQILLNNQSKNKYLEKVLQFNTISVNNIQSDSINEALVYLIEAEKILQKATEKNKQITKNIIVCTLHNLACCYQKNWDLQTCSNYIQALIYNLNSSLKNLQTTPISTINQLSTIKIRHEYSQKITQKTIQLMMSIQHKERLGIYYLQFCAVNSQIKNHSGALIAARKSIQVMKKMFKELLIFLKHHNSKISKQTRQQFEAKVRLVHQVSKINDNITVSQYDMILETTKFYLKRWNLKGSKKQIFFHQMAELENKFKNFSIGSVAQIQPIAYQNLFRTSQQRKTELISIEGILQKILVVIIGYFTISTQLRMLAQKKGPISQVSETNNSNINLNEPQFKEAQIFHLFAIMLSSIFIPFEILYMKHILMSYKNHYCNDLFDLKFQHSDDRLYEEFLFTISEIKKHSLLALDFEDSLRISQIRNQVFMNAGDTNVRFTKNSNPGQLKKFSLIAKSDAASKKKSKSNNKKTKSKTKTKSKKQDKKSTLKTISALSAQSKNKEKLEPAISTKSPQIHTQPSLSKSKNKKSSLKSPRQITSLQYLTQNIKKPQKKDQKMRKNEYGGIKTSQIKKKKTNNGFQQTNAYFLKKKSQSKSKRKSISIQKDPSQLISKKQLNKIAGTNSPTDIYFHKIDKTAKSKSKQKSVKKHNQFNKLGNSHNVGVGSNNRKSIYSHYM